MYRTKQIGWLIIILVSLVAIGQLVLIPFLEKEDEMALPFIYGTTIFLFVLILLFYQLEVLIENKKITLKFGIGLIKKQISLEEIEKTEIVQNSFWYGWGIRLTPYGWMWNIAGYEAVEITFKHGNKKFRIGAKDAKQLKKAIDEQL